MEETKKISNAPMILGIIGGVLGFPAAICAGACAAAKSIATTAAKGLDTSMVNLADTTAMKHQVEAMKHAGMAAASSGEMYMWLGVAGAILGLLSAFLYKKNSKLWGGIMILGGILSGITLVLFNLLSLIVCVLLLIGGIIALTQKPLATASAPAAPEAPAETKPEGE